MPHLQTWIRACDEPLFEWVFAMRPELTVNNARTDSGNFHEMDGLLLTGGPDISAEFLQQEIADASLIRDPDPKRDEWEFAALRHALDTGRPVLAICKGMQLLNVALGGTLRLDIAGHDAPELKNANVQPLRHAARSTIRFPSVNSSHHQAVEGLGGGLDIEAWCAADDIIEQVRLRDYPYATGVQYHPERDSAYRPLFEDFLQRIGAMG